MTNQWYVCYVNMPMHSTDFWICQVSSNCVHVDAVLLHKSYLNQYVCVYLLYSALLNPYSNCIENPNGPEKTRLKYIRILERKKYCPRNSRKKTNPENCTVVFKGGSQMEFVTCGLARMVALKIQK